MRGLALTGVGLRGCASDEVLGSDEGLILGRGIELQQVLVVDRRESRIIYV